ncbi:MAG TPA: cation diffusion facilitator family transporter [Methylomirabilota bacterium]|jgi:cobalt-zinc-cadmium efflux system protein|nr:cation diffusion facilitator family transporter [Methylomirabilota bacterium]
MSAHGHDRSTAAARSRPLLVLTLALTTVMMVVEFVAGLWTGSLALLADAGHMLTDATALALALLAVWIAARPPTPAKTYGYYRAEILAAVANALLLFAVAGSIMVEAWHRLRAPAPVLGGAMAAVAALGLAVNLIGAWLLHRGARESLTVRAAYLEVLGDALSSVAALVAGATIVMTGWTGADPLASAVIVALILPRSWNLLRQAVNVLLEGTPAHLSLAEIEAAMTGVSGVRRVHDLHVWTLTSGREAMSAHVVVDDVRESDRLLGALHAVLHARFGIDHTTIQLETAPPEVLRIKGRED